MGCTGSKPERFQQGKTQLQDVEMRQLSQSEDPIGWYLMSDPTAHKGMVVCEQFPAPLTSILNANSFIKQHGKSVEEFHQNWDLMDVLTKYQPVTGYKVRVTKEETVNFASFFLSGGVATGSGAAESQLANKLKSFISLQLFNIMRSQMEAEEYFDEIADAVANVVVNCAFDNDDELAGRSPTEEIRNFFFDDRTNRKWSMISESVNITNLLRNVGAVIYISGIICIDAKAAGLLGNGSVYINMDLRIKALVYNSFFLNEQKLRSLSYYIKRHTKQPPTLVFRTHEEYLKEAFKALEDEDQEEQAFLDQVKVQVHPEGALQPRYVQPQQRAPQQMQQPQRQSVPQGVPPQQMQQRQSLPQGVPQQQMQQPQRQSVPQGVPQQQRPVVQQQRPVVQQQAAPVVQQQKAPVANRPVNAEPVVRPQ